MMNAYKVDRQMTVLTKQLTIATGEYTTAYHEYTKASERWAAAQDALNKAHLAIISTVAGLKEEACGTDPKQEEGCSDQLKEEKSSE